MSETWYTSQDMGSSSRIETVEVERFNDKSVWIWGKRWGNRELRRHNRVNGFESYFPSFEEAKSHLKRIYADKVKDAQRQADQYTAVWHTIDAMRPERNPDSLEGRT